MIVIQEHFAPKIGHVNDLGVFIFIAKTPNSFGCFVNWELHLPTSPFIHQCINNSFVIIYPLDEFKYN